MKTICMLLGLCCLSFSERPQPATANAAPEPSSIGQQSDVPSGPSVFGVFVGRTPCHDLAREMNISVREECIKRKWEVILYQNPETHAPTTFELFGSGYRPIPRKGTWRIVNRPGLRVNTTIYELDPNGFQTFLSLLKADDNVLLFLGKDGDPLVGNIHFSYALNRLVKSGDARN